MNDIFISYAREDRSTAGMLARHISQAGWQVWWDHALNPGDSFRAVIEEQLRTARLVFVLWSRHSVKSPFVLDEASRAQRRGVLVPIIVDDIDPETLPLGFGGLHSVNLSDWEGATEHEGYQRLIDLLSNKLGAAIKQTEEKTAPAMESAVPPAMEQPAQKPPQVAPDTAAPPHPPAGASEGQSIPYREMIDKLPAVPALSELQAAAIYSLFFLAGLALVLGLVFQIRQDWNLWLAVSIPAMIFGAAGLALARRSLRRALTIAAINIILGIIIFLTAPG